VNLGDLFDHFVVRSGLSAALEVESDIVVIGEAKRGDEVLLAYQRQRPGVVLMDLQLPGLSGVQATAALRAHDPQARILVYSTFARDDEVQSALDAGAAGYVQKSPCAMSCSPLCGALPQAEIISRRNSRNVWQTCACVPRSPRASAKSSR